MEDERDGGRRGCGNELTDDDERGGDRPNGAMVMRGGGGDGEYGEEGEGEKGGGFARKASTARKAMRVEAKE